MLISQVVFWANGILSSIAILLGLIAIAKGWNEIEEFIILFVVTIIAIIFAWIISWVIALFIYGYGQLIDDTQKNKEATQTIVNIFKH